MSAIHYQLVQLFQQAGAAHHAAFADVDGDDPDWPDWYATFLQPELDALLEPSFSIPQLAETLARLAESHQSEASGQPWPEYYSAQILTMHSQINQEQKP